MYFLCATLMIKKNKIDQKKAFCLISIACLFEVLIFLALAHCNSPACQLNFFVIKIPQHRHWNFNEIDTSVN